MHPSTNRVFSSRNLHPPQMPPGLAVPLASICLRWTCRRRRNGFSVSSTPSCPTLRQRRSSTNGRARLESNTDAVVSCRLGGKNADGTRSRPELREWPRTSRLSGDIKRQKEETSTNVSGLNERILVTVPSLYRLSIGSHLSSYTTRRIK
jgi:hypothetical protein